MSNPVFKLITGIVLCGNLSLSAQTTTSDSLGNGVLSGSFEGTEPFWSMEIKDNKFILHCVNDVETGVIFLSKKQAHSETYAFSGEHIFGIIRESTGGGCDLDITEKENPTHELYFSYKNTTYMGCGWITK